ncbi:MAG: hypothetical protein PHC66_05215 [Candidatus Nanoarchaeia archaeon]|nr:hypothetical protein [Candidatus Nanoarchaeia archaeon]MDD5238908.1 hypothetical protein [Candidatus Nanoarchaeia archaeon]
MKTQNKWKRELTDPHFILFALTGIFLMGSGLFLFLSGDMAKTLSGLALWSYGLIALGFSLGFNFGKYGE